MDSVGATLDGRIRKEYPEYSNQEMYMCQIISRLPQHCKQTQDPLSVMCLRLCDVSKEQLDISLHAGMLKGKRASMKASDDVLQAPSGAMCSPSTKLYDQVLISMYHPDWIYPIMADPDKIPDNLTGILQLRSSSIVRTETSGVSESSSSKIQQDISSFMILSLRIPKSIIFKFLDCRFSMTRSLQIMGSTGLIFVPTLGSKMEKSPKDPLGTIPSGTCFKAASTRGLTLALKQRSLQFICIGAPLSSALVMPEALILDFQAITKYFKGQMILSNPFPGAAIFLVQECSIGLESSILAEVWPHIHVDPSTLLMIVNFLCKDSATIEQGENSQTVIEHLQLSLLFSSFFIPQQMILKLRSFLEPGAAASKSVDRSGKATVTDAYGGTFARELLAVQSTASATVDAGSRNKTLRVLILKEPNTTINNFQTAGDISILDCLAREIFETCFLYQKVREMKTERSTRGHHIKIGESCSVVVTPDECNSGMPPGSPQMHAQPQFWVLRRLASKATHKLGSIGCILRPWIISQLIRSTDAHPINSAPQDLFQPFPLEFVSAFGGAAHLGQRMTDASRFQLSQNRSIYGLVLFGIALTGLSSFIIYDSSGNGVIYLVSTYLVVTIGALLMSKSFVHVRCSCGGRGCQVCGGGGTSGIPD